MPSPPIERIADKVSRDPFARSLGIELLELRPGYSRLAMRVQEQMVNFHGLPHGGALFALADAAFAAASNSHGQTAVALEVSISYRTAVAVGTRLVAEATEEDLGHRTALYRMTVRTEGGELVAACRGTVYRKKEWFCKSEV